MKTTDVVIIGAGVIGVSTAYALSKRGVSVVVIDRGPVCDGSSYGNAGLICPCHSTPIPGPGVVVQALRWMLQADSPFLIRPRAERAFMRWLWEFRKYCNPRAHQRAIPILRDFQRASLARYRRWIAESGIDCDFRERGGLELFLSAAHFEAAKADVAAMQSHGIDMALLDRGEALALEPAASPDIQGAVHYREDAHLDPARFVSRLAEVCARQGVQFKTHTRVNRLEIVRSRIDKLQLGSGEIAAGTVVVAAGAWSAELLGPVGVQLLLQGAKGYSITMEMPELSPKIPLHLAEARMVISPIGRTLRFAGTLELAGLDASLNPGRIAMVRRGGRRYLAHRGSLNEVETWAGLRPVAPDGLPYLGKSAAIENLVVATGHAMLGMSMGPESGEIAAALACGESPGSDLKPFRLDRFGG